MERIWRLRYLKRWFIFTYFLRGLTWLVYNTLWILKRLQIKPVFLFNKLRSMLQKECQYGQIYQVTNTMKATKHLINYKVKKIHGVNLARIHCDSDLCLSQVEIILLITQWRISERRLSNFYTNQKNFSIRGKNLHHKEWILCKNLRHLSYLTPLEIYNRY